MAYNKKENLRNNIEAIKIALSSGIKTEEERGKLSQYSGFGGLKCILLDPDKPDQFTKSEQDLIPLVRELHDTLDLYSVDEREYKEYFSSLKRSILSSFYTPTELVGAINEVFSESGIKIGKLLDPSSGTGEFLKVQADAYTAIEKDLITGKILKALHPGKDVRISGFEDIPRYYENTFDMVTSNIPFGDFKVFDPVFLKSKDKAKRDSINQIHNYYFFKSLDMLREGGLTAFITSTGVMDSASNESLRKSLLKNYRLVSAIRLPRNTFTDKAGTEVQSDIIVLQKDTHREKAFSEIERQFVSVAVTELGENINSIYLRGKNTASTSMMQDTDPYGKPALIFHHSGGVDGIAADVKKMLGEDMQKNFNQTLYAGLSIEKKKEVIKPQMPYQLSLFDDFNSFVTNIEDKSERVEKKEQKKFIEYQSDFFGEGSFVLSPAGELGTAIDEKRGKAIADNYYPKEDYEYVKAYIELRNVYFKLKEYEETNKKENTHLRGELNASYDKLVSDKRYLRDSEMLLLNDPTFSEIQSLELVDKDGSVHKADIFREPVAFGKNDITHTIEEALSYCLNKINEVNIAYISQLTLKSEQEVVDGLEGKIFYNPSEKKYETADVMLSGNVVSKLERFLIQAQYESNYQIQKTCEALKEVIPEKIPFEEIGLNLGERWIPESIYSEFVANKFDVYNASVRFNGSSDDFSVTGNNSYYANQRYGVKSHSRYYDAYKVMRFALLDDMPKMTIKVGTGEDERTIPDNEGIQKMNASTDLIKTEFREWLLSLPESKKAYLEALYNKKFNCYVKPRYNGSYQSFPDLDFEKLGFKDLYPSQKDSVLMLKNNGGGIIDHEVGGGKTLIMCSAAYEMKRLGLANKPLIIGLKANTDQIADTYRQAYPNAKILCPTEADLSKENRQNFLSKIQNNNWDCIIMTHDQFKAIPQSVEVQKKIIEQEIEKLREAISNLDTSDYKTYKSQEKALLKRQENLEVKIKNMMYEINSRKDQVVDFKTMGIDHIFVDESHKYKNLMFATRHDRVAGLGNSKGSDRALNLLFAIRTIQEKTGKDLGATFLSGTTISNSLTELYNIFVYLRPKALEEQGIFSFDSWAATYTVKSKDFEFSVTNEIIQKERFRHFVKVPELASFYAQITDYKTADDIGIERPKKDEILVDLEQTPYQEEMFNRLKDFAKTADGPVIFREPLSESEEKAKMLIATNTAQKAALDMRLISPERFPDGDGSKVAVAAQNIFEHYDKYKHVKGTQFVFSDLGTFKSKQDFSVYSALKDDLVAKGIPEKEIQFIQSHNTPRKRAELFKKMNAGEVRVLVGSTEMLGTGVNAQERVTAIHHLNIPWKPSDLEQRDGRGVRKGNWVAQAHCDNTVKTYVYAVKKSLDNYKFNLLKNKSTFISQIKKQNINVRTIDEGGMDENTGMNFSEYIAVLSGDTNLLQKTKLERKISQLKNEETLFNKGMRNRDSQMADLREKTHSNNAVLEKLNIDLNKSSLIPKNEEGKTVFKAKIGEKVFTDIKQAGERLNEIFDKENRDTANYQKIGEFYGFDILIKAEQTLSDMMGEEVYQNKIFVGGENKYSHNFGNLARTSAIAGEYMENALNRIPALITTHQNKRHELADKLDALQRLENTVWPKREELKDSELQLKELNMKIEKSLNNINTGKSGSMAVEI